VLAARFARTRPRVSGVEAIAAVILVGLLVALSTVVATRLSGTLVLAAPALLLVCAFLIANPRIELSLAIVGLYLGLLDGYLKLSTGSNLAVAGRAVLLYAVVVGALLRLAVSDHRVRLPKYTLHVALFAGIVLAQALNPGTPGLKGAIGGVRQQLEFVPLLFFGYAYMRSERRIRTFLVLLLLVVACNTVVAVFQYTLTPDQFAAWGPGYSDKILGTGGFEDAARTFSDATGAGHVRPFGLGSDSGVSGTLGWLAVAGALAFIAVPKSPRLRIVGMIGLLACGVGIVAAQSRSVIVAGVFAIIAFVALTVSSREATRGLVTVLVGGMIIYLSVTTFVAHNDRSGFSRLDTLSSSRIQQTIETDRGGSAKLIPAYALKYPLGVGIGRSGAATGFGGSPSGLNAENEFTFLIGEIGTLGLLAFASLWMRVLWDGVIVVRRTADRRVRLYLAALVVPLATMTLIWFASTPTTAPPSAPFFWFVAGIIAWAVTAGPDAFVTASRSAASGGHA
jgi:hypothetical protein